MSEFAVALVLATGLGLACGFWLVCYAIGIAVVALSGAQVPDRVAARRVDVCIATACGCAIVIVASFVLGACGVLRAPALLCVIAAIAAILTALATRRSRDYAGNFARTLGSCANAWWLGAFALAAALSVPAVLPPTSFDAGMYHLPHALGWANDGRLSVDPFVRYPLGQYNVELLFADVFVLHLDRYVQFMGWLGFAWTVCGIAAAVQFLLDRHGFGERTAGTCALLAAAGYAVGPLALRYADAPLVDITAGVTLLAAILASIRAHDDFDRYAVAFALIAGSFVGMKSSFLPFAILLPLLLYAVARSALASKRRNLVALFAYVVTAAPWFVFNLAIAGDPISPILNATLGRPDPFYSGADYQAIQSVLHHRSESLVAFPFRLFAAAPVFEEYGTSFNVIFIYGPIAGAAALLLYRPFRKAADLTILTFATAASIGAILVITDTVARYVLHVYALYVVWFAVAIPIAVRFALRSSGFKRAGAVPALSAVLIVLGAVPSPGSDVAYSEFAGGVRDASAAVLTPDGYLHRLPGFAEVGDLAKIVAGRCSGCRVYTIGLEYDTYAFRRDGVESIGDWFGPARYLDMVTALRAGKLDAYLRTFDVGAVLFRTAEVDRWLPGGSNGLIATLEKSGFTQRATTDGTTLLLRHDLADARSAANLSTVRPVVTKKRSGLSLTDAFALGSMNSRAAASTPTGRGVLVFSWPYGAGTAQALTVLSGFTYRYAKVVATRDAVLEFDVAKVQSIGGPAAAWIDEDAGGKHVRIFSATCEPATNGTPAWRHVRVPLLPGTVSLTFGADSLGNDYGDWIGYANPTLTNATLR